jgi:predicted neuraminidase
MRTLIIATLLFASGCKFSRKGSDLSDAGLPTGTANPAAEPEEPAMFRQELIIPENTFPANHASTIVELEPGRLMSCWFAGSKEAARDAQIYCSEKTDDTSAWTKPRVVVKKGETSRGLANKFVGNPVLFKDMQGTLWLFYEAVKAFGHSASVIDYKVSQDGGQTFSEGEAFVGSAANFGHLPRNKPLQLSSGRFMMPAYRELVKNTGYVVMVTPQNGDITDRRTYEIPGSEHLQPSLTIKENTDGTNKVLAYLRNKKGAKVLVSEFDFLEGKFSAPREVNIPNPNAAVDAVTTDDNTVLIVYNDSTSGRSPLSLAVSADGVNFKKIYDLETAPGEWSYPAIIRDEKGFYHLTYTYNRKSIKYVSFDNNWLKARM